MSRRRRAKRNPADAVTYWAVWGMVLVGGVAVWAWMKMQERERQKTLGIQ